MHIFWICLELLAGGVAVSVVIVVVGLVREFYKIVKDTGGESI